jgi:hypothetical protein
MGALVNLLKSGLGQEQQSALAGKFEALKPALPVAVAVGGPLYSIARGGNPLESIAMLERTTSSQVPSAPTRAALITTGILAREFHSDGPDLRAMVKDSRQRRYVLALLLRDVAADVHDNGAIATWVSGVVLRNQADIVRIVELAHDVETQVAQIRSGGLGTAGGVDLAAGGLVHSAALIFDAVDPLVPSTPAWTKSRAIIHSVDRIHTAFASHQYVGGLLELNTFTLDQFGVSIPSKPELVLNTAASIAAAQTAEQASAALEAAAEPVLSFRAKRTSSDAHGSTMFGFNSYAAYTYGSENAFASGFAPAHKPYTGLTMPIGLEWSVAAGDPIASLSFFLPLVDLGTIATFRLGDDGKTQNTQTVTLAQLLAPGAYAVIGITRKVPISLGVGAQYVTSVRRAANGTPLNAVRAGAWLGVDVPLFHF